MELLLTNIISYLIGLAANLHSDEITKRLNEELSDREKLRAALHATRPLGEEVSAACIQLARNQHIQNVPQQESHLWRLLSEEHFQRDLSEWLQAGGIVEGETVKQRIAEKIEDALHRGNAPQERIDYLKKRYFEQLERAIFSNPLLVDWRHQLSLDYLRGIAGELKRLAEENAGHYSAEKQQAVLTKYRDIALDAWDIIDLSNLPEGDIHIATQKLMLRQLYMPLRLNIEPAREGEGVAEQLSLYEQQRHQRRQWEAGHLGAEEETTHNTSIHAPIGQQLASSKRLVVLGDPGGGKTTLLRWLATACLLRNEHIDAFNAMPDTDTLPDTDWLPVLIRCRDLGEPDLCRSFSDFLAQHLNKTEMQPKQAEVMLAVVLERIAQGKVLLLIDGLDEITNPQTRVLFSQELERTALRYPKAPIIVTSRIVGYRDMPYRIGTGFEHGMIAELNNKDKEHFAKNWVAVTEQHRPPREQAERTKELQQALHASDRIERLTGNPMLLTTLALIKRKVGKLPNRRHKLYAEAVGVLLNWNNTLYEPIEEEEALPQLHYLAYEMCRRGVQRLPHNELLDLLDQLRDEYPRLRALKKHPPEEFLQQLEARSSLLIKSGGEWRENPRSSEAVWEFRHLTFQEYLAARALIEGHFPNRDKSLSLAEQVAPLAGEVERLESEEIFFHEMVVTESWREALRLLVADCRDDDVDDVLLAILTPLERENSAETTRPRAHLAALCLAEEPNVSDETAKEVLEAYTTNTNDNGDFGRIHASYNHTAVSLNEGIWASQLKNSLLQAFKQHAPGRIVRPGWLLGMTEVEGWISAGNNLQALQGTLCHRLGSEGDDDRITALLSLTALGFRNHTVEGSELTPLIINSLSSPSPPLRFAAAWALQILIKNPGWDGDAPNTRHLNEHYINQICQILHNTPPDEINSRLQLILLLGHSSIKAATPCLLHLLRNNQDKKEQKYIVTALRTLADNPAVAPLAEGTDLEPLLSILNAPTPEIRLAAAALLVRLGEERGKTMLFTLLRDDSNGIRREAISNLSKLQGDKIEATLLTEDHDGINPWIDPREPITEEHVKAVAEELTETPDEIRARYEGIAEIYGLTLAWKQAK